MTDEPKHDTPRHRLLKTLNEDLFFGAWDEPNKLWFMQGEPGDEFLEYVGGFNMEPSHWLLHRSEEGLLKPHVTGMVLAYECWTYPEPLATILMEHDDIYDAYTALVPADRHPEHNQLRTIILVASDGAIMRCDKYEDDGRVTWMDMREVDIDPETGEPIEDTAAPENGPTGNAEVDYMRTMLGINPLADNPLAELAGFSFHSHEIRRLLAEAKVQDWPRERVVCELYWAAPDELQPRLFAAMNEAAREYLAEHNDHEHH